VRTLPVAAHPLHQLGDPAPEVVARVLASLVEKIERVDQLPVDVELQLLRRGVADPHWARAAIALEMIERALRQLPPSVERVDGLQLTGARGLRAAALHPLREQL